MFKQYRRKKIIKNRKGETNQKSYRQVLIFIKSVNIYTMIEYLYKE